MVYRISAFDEAMLNIYQRALSEAHFSSVSKGYTALWERKRLNLTIEAVIHDNPKWHPLFTDEELAICKTHLTNYDYFS
jgi:hypothetical protein